MALWLEGLGADNAAAVFLPLLLVLLLYASIHFDFGAATLARSWAQNTTLGGYICTLLCPFIALVAAILLAFAVKTE